MQETTMNATQPPLLDDDTTDATSKRSRFVEVVYKTSTPCRFTDTASVPVFMLPQQHDEELAVIPEDAELHLGYFLKQTLFPHQRRVFTGLVSMSDPDDRREVLEESDTMLVIYGAFSFEIPRPSATPMTMTTTTTTMIDDGIRTPPRKITTTTAAATTNPEHTTYQKKEPEFRLVERPRSSRRRWWLPSIRSQ